MWDMTGFAKSRSIHATTIENVNNTLYATLALLLNTSRVAIEQQHQAAPVTTFETQDAAPTASPGRNHTMFAKPIQRVPTSKPCYFVIFHLSTTYHHICETQGCQIQKFLYYYY